MSTSFIIFLSVAGAVIVFFTVIVLIAFVRSRRLAKVPPPPPCKCPACSSEKIDVFSSGLWDGEDSAGRGTGGIFQVGTCKSCGVHCKHFSVWDNDKKERRYEIRVLTDEEWQREIGPSMKWQRQRAEWPFISGDQSHVA
jgi:hypothetical protein